MIDGFDKIPVLFYNELTMHDSEKQVPDTGECYLAPDEERKNDKPGGSGDDSAMDLTEHLTQLRARLIKSLLAIGLALVLTIYYSDNLMRFLSDNISGVLKGEKLVFISPAEAFFVSIKLALYGAALISAPYVLFQIWSFIYIALTEREKKYFNYMLVFSTFAFYLGLIFSIYIAIPVGIGFLVGYSNDMFRPMISVGAYSDFLIGVSLVFGIVFELPLAMIFLNLIGLVSREWFVNNRKYSILVIFILAGIFSPPDVVSQLIVAVPMLALYEIGLIFIKIAGSGASSN